MVLWNVINKYIAEITWIFISFVDKSQAPVNGHVNAVSTRWVFLNCSVLVKYYFSILQVLGAWPCFWISITINYINPTIIYFSKTQSVTTPETQTTKSQVSPGDSLHFTIDIGGQKHELDFGGNSDAAHREKSHPYATSYHSSTTTSDLPPPPVPDVPTSIKLSRDAPPPPPAYPASPDLPPPPIDMQFNQVTARAHKEIPFASLVDYFLFLWLGWRHSSSTPTSPGIRAKVKVGFSTKVYDDSYNNDKQTGKEWKCTWDIECNCYCQKGPKRRFESRENSLRCTKPLGSLLKVAGKKSDIFTAFQ